MKKLTDETMTIPKCHRCGADLVQIKLTEDSEVGWYCVGCDSDLMVKLKMLRQNWKTSISKLAQ
jgi:DNA-directed RNA polymerase subunit RPC12/RpoP